MQQQFVHSKSLENKLLLISINFPPKTSNPVAQKKGTLCFLGQKARMKTVSPGNLCRLKSISGKSPEFFFRPWSRQELVKISWDGWICNTET